MRTRPIITYIFVRNRRLSVGPLCAETQGFIYCRLTVLGKDKEFATGLALTYGEWSVEAHRLRGKSVAVKQANEALTKLENRLNDLAADLDRQGKPITAQRLHQLYQKNGAAHGLLPLFADFLTEQQALVGVEISKATLAAHRARYGNLVDFLTAHNLLDLRPEEFTHNLADKMLYWLLTQQGFARNTALKNLQNVSQVLRWAVRRERLDRNPLDLYRYKLAEAKPLQYLTEEEVRSLTSIPLASKQLERVRDCFVLQCYTGLAYADLAALDMASQAETLPDGRRLLRVRRQKSTITHGYECVIPLLPEAERILALYGDKLPVCVNQLYNRCLKQIGLFAGLDPDKCTSHVGRKTAGVLLLNAGIRMEVVSKFLGHASVRMTEKVYAKILDKTVLNEFDRVFAPTPPTPTIPDHSARMVPMWGGQAA
jgi:integrase/recombinase XerD